MLAMLVNYPSSTLLHKWNRKRGMAVLLLIVGARHRTLQERKITSSHTIMSLIIALSREAYIVVPWSIHIYPIYCPLCVRSLWTVTFLITRRDFFKSRNVPNNVIALPIIHHGGHNSTSRNIKWWLKPAASRIGVKGVCYLYIPHFP